MRFKNFLLVALLAAVAAIAIVVWFIFSKDKNPCAAIPSETAIVLDFNPIGEDAQPRIPYISNYGLGFFVEKSDAEYVQHQVHQARQFVQYDGSLNHAFKTCRLLAAHPLRGDYGSQLLFVLDLRATSAHLRNALARLKDKANFDPASRYFMERVEVSPRQFRSDTLWTFAKPSGITLVFVQKNGLLIFAQSVALVEDALANLDAGDNWWSKCAYLRQPDPAQPFRAVFRGEVLAQRLGERLLPQHQRLLPLLQNFDWLGLSWDGHTLRAEAGLKALPNPRTAWDRNQLGDIYGVLPSNTAFALRVGFSTSWPVLKKMDRPLSPDFEEFIGPWWGREAAFVVTEPLSNHLADHEFWVLEARDTARASVLLRAYGQQRGLLKNYDYQTFVIRQLLDGGLLSPLADEGSAFQNPACAVVGGHVVFAASPAALERWIDQYVVGETLSANADFLQMAQSLPAESGGALLLNSASLPAFARSLCQPDGVRKNALSLKALATMGWIGADIRPSGNDGSLTLNVTHSQALATSADARTGLVWKTPLAAEVALAPQVVSTPWEIGGVSILVQDVRHQLYCLTQSGQLRWRRQLPGPILSDVQGLNFFKNQMPCYFFNTPDALWLLDENGRDVEGFPLKLRSPATNGAVSVSFGNNDEYDFFVALENGNVQGFNQLGQPLEGWNPQPVGERLTAPLLHFQHEEKDYLAVLTRSGRLSVFGKNGQLRFPPVQFEGPFEGAMQVNLMASTPCIVCFNTSGKAFACDITGRASALPLSPYEGAGAQSDFLPLGNSINFEYAVLAGPTLTCGHYDEGQYRRFFFQKNDVPADEVFMPQSGCMGLLRKQRRQVVLYWAGGRAARFEGSTAFRLLGIWHNKQMLVVGNGASVCGYAVAAK